MAIVKRCGRVCGYGEEVWSRCVAIVKRCGRGCGYSEEVWSGVWLW